MDATAATILIGIGATALIDLWALVRRGLLGVAVPDYGLVGRWLAYMPRGRLMIRMLGPTVLCVWRSQSKIWFERDGNKTRGK